MWLLGCSSCSGLRGRCDTRRGSTAWNLKGEEEAGQRHTRYCACAEVCLALLRRCDLTSSSSPGREPGCEWCCWGSIRKLMVFMENTADCWRQDWAPDCPPDTESPGHRVPRTPSARQSYHGKRWHRSDVCAVIQLANISRCHVNVTQPADGAGLLSGPATASEPLL